MHPYAITHTPPAPTGSQAAPGTTPLPARANRARPGPARHDTSLILGPVDTAPADARATLKLALKVWGLPHLTDPAELICSELVTNAITASRDKAPPGTQPVERHPGTSPPPSATRPQPSPQPSPAPPPPAPAPASGRPASPAPPSPSPPPPPAPTP
ncbi:MAG: hypothetical protein JWM19_2884 [Actinomycetia bacterium]|nr:hypothetical protein [Actinomycetes bacterium]